LFIGLDPFVKATINDFEEVLLNLLRDRQLREEKRREGLQWVHEFPHPRRIISEIYKEYRRIGWIS